MILRTTGLALLMASLAACGGDAPAPETPAEPPAAEAPAPEAEAPVEQARITEDGHANYAHQDNWLCLPETAGNDACSPDLSTTVVDVVDGEVVVSTEGYTPAADPAVDCFYVYPTTSTDQGGNSDLDADPAELFTTAGQFARFGSVCRQFAPMYRQVTLRALRANMAGQPMEQLSLIHI